MLNHTRDTYEIDKGTIIMRAETWSVNLQIYNRNSVTRPQATDQKKIYRNDQTITIRDENTDTSTLDSFMLRFSFQ